MRAWLVVLATAFASACAALPGGPSLTVETPLARQDDGRMFVYVAVNGMGPYPFVLDTGAGVSVLDRSLIDELGLSPKRFDVRVFGVTGVRTSPGYGGVAIGIAEETIALDWVAGLDLFEGPARGIIGIDVLGQFAVELDGPNDILRLGRRPYRPPRGALSARIPLVVGASGLPLLDVRINGARGRALVDTGLSGVIVDPDFAEHAGVRTSVAPVTLSDVVGEREIVRRTGQARLQIGRARAARAHVTLFRSPAFEPLAGDEPTVAILGAGVFKTTNLVLDFHAGRVYLVRAPADRPA